MMSLFPLFNQKICYYSEISSLFVGQNISKLHRHFESSINENKKKHYVYIEYSTLYSAPNKLYLTSKTSTIEDRAQTMEI